MKKTVSIILLFLLSFALTLSCDFFSKRGAPTATTPMNPANEASNVSFTHQVLRWTKSSDPQGDAVFYDVGFGTSSDALTTIGSGLEVNFLYLAGEPPEMLDTSSTTTVDLQANTTYYWKVISKDASGNSTESEVWSFTTESDGTQTTSADPIAVSGVYPADGSSISHADASANYFNWSTSQDPDAFGSTTTTSGDDSEFGVLYYDLYVGASSGTLHLAEHFEADPENTPVVSSTSAITTILGDYFDSVQKGDTYYWQVIVYDSEGASSEGPVTSFTIANVPDSPVSTSDYAENYSVQPTLTWDVTVDSNIEGDIVCDLYYGTISAGLPGTANVTDIAYSSYTSESVGGGGTATFTVDFADEGLTDLAPDTTYLWQVVVKYTTGQTVTGPLWTFDTQGENTAPTFGPNSIGETLQFFTNNGTNDLATYLINWSDAIDSEGDFVTYTLDYSGNSDLSSPTTVTGINSTQAIVEDLAVDDDYYYRITATDHHGLSSHTSIQQFNTAEALSDFDDTATYTAGTVTSGSYNLGNDAPCLKLNNTDTTPAVSTFSANTIGNHYQTGHFEIDIRFADQTETISDAIFNAEIPVITLLEVNDSLENFQDVNGFTVTISADPDNNDQNLYIYFNYDSASQGITNNRLVEIPETAAYSWQQIEIDYDLNAETVDVTYNGTGQTQQDFTNATTVANYADTFNMLSFDIYNNTATAGYDIWVDNIKHTIDTGTNITRGF